MFQPLRKTLALPIAVALALAVALSGVSASVKPPKNPAKIIVDVTPQAVSPGGEAEVTLKLEPIDGVKINRYPKIKLRVPVHEGLVAETEGSIGSSTPPPPDQKDKKANYWNKVDPLIVKLTLDEAATSGNHEIDAKLVYYFCVPASGFCAPKRVPLKIPIVIE
jgi:hypothetical protein